MLAVRVLVIGLLAVTGCSQHWKPPLESVEVATTAVTANLSSRFAHPGSISTYRRTFPLDEGAEPVEYVVRCEASRRVEGALVNSGAGSLLTYMLPGGPEPDKYAFPWPSVDRSMSFGFFLAFDPPVTVYPQAATGGVTEEHNSILRCYSDKGRPIYNGEVTRSITLEGYETVTVDDVPYSDCVRLRAETRFRFPWIARVDLTEYIWLAPGLGEVKLLRRWRGFVFLAYIENATLDELVRQTQDDSPAKRDTADKPEGEEDYARCAVYLSPSLPKPLLAGLIAEFGPDENDELDVGRNSNPPS